MRVRIFKFFTYFVKCFSGLRELSEAINSASSAEELDDVVLGARR